MGMMKEELNKLGQIVVQNYLFDNLIDELNSIKENEKTELGNFLRNLNESQFDLLIKLFTTIGQINIFSFIKFFEENSEYKLLITENNQEINFADLPIMHGWLPYGDEGWIRKFTKHNNCKNYLE
jgi:hypothetical protein